LLTDASLGGIGQELVSVDARGAEVAADWENLRSPENYLGYDRIENFAQFCCDSSKEQQNHEDYNMASISFLAHSGPHGYFYGQAVRSMILVGANEVRISRIRAMWTAVLSPLNRSLSYILLDLKKRCQAFPSRGNSILIELPIPQYSPDQVHSSVI
jgi:hypothetical protein